MTTDKGGRTTLFDRHPRATIGVAVTLLLILSVILVEVFLKTFSGLGNPVLYQISPLYGYRPKPNQVVAPKGGFGSLYASRVTINNLGLRATGEWSPEPARKIVFLGDSVTYGGQYVADAELFSSVAGRSLPGWQVGNGGVNAWGVENIVGLVMDHGFLPAEAVVTCVIEGDFYRGLTRVASVPVWAEPPRFALQDLLMHNVWRINETRFGASADYVVRDAKELDRIVDRAARRLRELDDHLRQRQVRHLVYILPTRSQAVKGAAVDDRVRQALARHGVPAKYLLSELVAFEADPARREAWFHDEVHLDPPGHEVYGKLMGTELAALVAKP